MVAAGRAGETPERFTRMLTALRRATARPEVRLDEVPAPQRLAPHAVALGAEVLVDGAEVANGRFVLLYDTDGQDAWEGDARIVTFTRADCDHEMVADPLLPSVAWAWLCEALEQHDATHVAPSGTVTRVASEAFGGMQARPTSAEVEIRASWSPSDDRLDRHLEAWLALLCTCAGLPPLPAGVAALPPPRRRR